MNPVTGLKLSFAALLISLRLLVYETSAWQTSKLGVCAEFLKDENQSDTKEVYKFCCEGFTQVNSSDSELHCTAVCSRPCVLGTCIKPETCTCLDGYKPRSKNQCVPNCMFSCVNSFCSAPDTCTCFPGFRNDPGNKTRCLPQLGPHDSGPANDSGPAHDSFRNRRYPSFLNYEGNRTFAVQVNRSCSSLFLDDSNETALDSTEMLCGLVETSTESLLTLRCRWSDRYDGYSKLPSYLELEVTSTGAPYDVKFLIQFPPVHGAHDEDTSCDICISHPVRSRYISLEQDISLIVRPCHRMLWSMMDWVALLGAGLVGLFVVSTAMLLLCASVLIMTSRKPISRHNNFLEYYESTSNMCESSPSHPQDC